MNENSMTDKTIKERLRQSADNRGKSRSGMKVDVSGNLKSSENVDKNSRFTDQWLKQKFGSTSSRKIESYLNNLSKSKPQNSQKGLTSKIEVIETKPQSLLKHYLSEKRLDIKKPEQFELAPPSKNEKSSKYISCHDNNHFIHPNYKNPENMKQTNIFKAKSIMHHRYKSNLSLTKKPFSREKDKKIKNNSLILSLLAKNFENQKIKNLIANDASTNIVTKNKNVSKVSQDKPFKISSLPKQSEMPFSPQNNKSLGKNQLIIQNAFIKNRPISGLQMINEITNIDKNTKKICFSPKPLSPCLKQGYNNEFPVGETKPNIPKSQIQYLFDIHNLQKTNKPLSKPMSKKNKNSNSLLDHGILTSEKNIEVYDTKQDSKSSAKLNSRGSSSKKYHMKKLSCQNLHPEVKEQFPNSFTKRSAFEVQEEQVAPKFIQLFNNMYREQETDEMKDLKQEIRNGYTNGKKVPETSLQFYEIIKLLGKGSFGKVYLGLQKLTNRLVAIKCLEKLYFKDEITKKKILSEVKILKKLLGHPNTIKLLEVFENKKYVFFVMEYASNGDLLKYLKTKISLEEEEAKYLFYQVSCGLRYIHKQGIIHRDIKLDNILIDEAFHCKICDFGVSRYMKPHELVNEQCGTPAYLAPEIVLEKGYKGFGADIWSLGVLLFCILTGAMPFKASTIDNLHKLIIKGEFEFPENNQLTSEAKDLIKRMLVVNPDKRITIEEVIKHKWLAGINLDKSTMKNIQEFEKNQFNYLDEFEYQINDFALNYVCGLGFEKETLEESIINKQLNHGTACYFLMEKDFI
jgi:serine/threonine protein kinase